MQITFNQTPLHLVEHRFGRYSQIHIIYLQTICYNFNTYLTTQKELFMAEEKKESKSSMLQIRVPDTLKDNLEAKAKKAGVSLNQYIMFLFVEKMEQSEK